MKVVIDEEFNATIFWDTMFWLADNPQVDPEEAPPEIRKMVKRLMSVLDHKFWPALRWLYEADLNFPQEVPEGLWGAVMVINELGRCGEYTPLVVDVE